MSDCPACTLRKQSPKSGRYDMLCATCCAHLVRSARPLKHAQEAMFASIARHEGAPTKAQIISGINDIDRAQHESQTRKVSA
jgi:hypothetical protein